MNVLHMEYCPAAFSDPGCTSLRRWLKIALLAAALLVISLFGLTKEAHGDTAQPSAVLHKTTD